MAWAADFKTGLAKQVVTLGYTVDGLAIFDALGQADTPGGGCGLSTLGRTKPTSGTWIRGIDPLSVQFSTEAVDLRTCTYSGGEFRFDFVWESAADRSTFYDAYTRGTPLVLKAQIDFDQPADGEALRMGVVADITESGRRITVRCWDLLSVLHPRIVKSTWPVLFGSLDTAGTVIDTTGYTSGDATIYVTDATIFEKDSSASYYVAKIVPDTGDPFYVRFTGVNTGVTPHQLTGATGAQYGTTAGTASAGQAVYAVAAIEGTPFDIALKVLISSGDLSGGDDVLPESWGYGLNTSYCDDADMAVWEAVVAPGSGAHAWSWLALGADENGIGTLTAWMARGGMWLVNRQGQITARALQDLWSSPQSTGATITDEDIVALSASLSPRDPSQPFEAVQVRHLYDSSGTATAKLSPGSRSDNRTWPLEEYTQADLADVIYTNGSAITTNYGDRMKLWYTSIPERIRVRVVGLKWMQYCVGDVISLTSTALRGFLLNTEDGPSAQPYMIAAIRWGLPQPWVDFDLVLPPEDVTDERG